MDSQDFAYRRKQIESAIAEVLLRLPSHCNELHQYLSQEIAKLHPDHRLPSLQSLAPGGEKTMVAVLLSNARFHAKVRWGDFLLAIQEELSYGLRPLSVA